MSTTPNNRAVRLRLAVAQTSYRDRPGDVDGFRAAGAEVRDLMTAAKNQGADLIQFCEGTLCFPHKQLLSSDPDRLAESDWSRFAWDTLQTEIAAIAEHAAGLGLWTVLGTQRRQGSGRPTTGLDVIDDHGRLVARYDERVLSHTKASYMYRSGDAAVTIEVNGVRIGFASGLEVHFPELFSGYEADDVEVVLFSTAGPGDPGQAKVFADEARAQASTLQLWIGYAAPSATASAAPSGVLSPRGEPTEDLGVGWVAQCPAEDRPAVVVAEVLDDADNPARDWRRTIRTTHPALAAI